MAEIPPDAVSVSGNRNAGTYGKVVAEEDSAQYLLFKDLSR